MIVLVYLLGQQNTFLFLYYSELPIAPASNAISFDAQLYLQNKRKGRRIPQTLATLPSQPSETKRLLLDI